MRKKFVMQLLSSVFIVYFAANCSAVNLDAPIGKNIPVRAEFERVRHAYGVAVMRSSTIPEMHKTVSAIISENKQKNTDTEAFLLGLYYFAWFNMDLRLELIQKQDFLSVVDIEELKSGKGIAMMYYKEFRRRQTDMNIDNETLCSVAGIKNYNDFKQKFEQWDEIMKQPAEASIYEKLIKDLLTYKKGNNLGIVFNTVGEYFDHKAFKEKGARKYVEERMEFLSSEISFEFYQKTGKSPLIFQVALLNMSDKVIEVNPINFKITTKDGYTVPISNFTHETINNFPIVSLEPNTKTGGMLTFGIDRGDKSIEIIYDDKIGNRVSREYKDAVLLERLLREGKKD